MKSYKPSSGAKKPLPMQSQSFKQDHQANGLQTTDKQLRWRLSGKVHDYFSDYYRSRRKLAIISVIVLGLGLLLSGIGIAHFRLLNNEWNEWILHLGADFISAFVVFFAFDILLQRIEEDKVKTHETLDHAGIIKGIFDKIEDNSGASDKIRDIRIWESWTNLFEVSEKWRHNFEMVLVEALKKGVHIKVLLVNPGSIGMNLRQTDLDGGLEEHAERCKKQDWHRDWDVELNVLKNLKCFDQIRDNDELTSDDAGRLEVRLYDSQPSIALYSWGTKAFASFFPKKELSDQIEQLEFSTETRVGEWIIRQFDDEWKGSKLYKPELKHIEVYPISGENRKNSVKVQFIKNDADDEDSPFCISSEEIAAIYDEFSQEYGFKKLGVVLREDIQQNDDLENVGKLKKDGKLYQIERYKKDRMKTLFNAKYGPHPDRRVFRLKKESADNNQ